jgi:hypothetical protein
MHPLRKEITMAEANKNQTLTVTDSRVNSQLNVGETERKGRPIFDDVESARSAFPAI